MRLACANDKVFDTLMTENDKLTFNLFELVKQNGRAFISTDDASYIFGQNSRRDPSWLFLKECPEGKTFDELVTLVSGMVKLNALFKINADTKIAASLLDEVAQAYMISYSREIEMEVYACNDPIPFECVDGKMISPREEHREILKEFVVKMIRDSAGLEFDTDDSEKFTSALLSSPSFFLWENNEGKIVSMAKIAHKSNGMAKLNAIFTDTKLRGKDNTKMLLSQITSPLVSEGYTPLIYVDRLNTDIIEAYKLLGYKKVGEVTQFAFHH